MRTKAFVEIAETMDFLPDWEERYAHVIALGKAMPPLDPAFRVDATKVHGCSSQVWLVQRTCDGIYHFQGDADALIVRGLVAIIIAMFDGLSADEILAVDAQAGLAELGLDQNLSAQRTNGLRAMIKKIREIAATAMV